MSINEMSNKDRSPQKLLKVLRKAEHGRIMHKIQQGTTGEIVENIENTGTLLGTIKDDFKNGKEIFTPAKKKGE